MAALAANKGSVQLLAISNGISRSGGSIARKLSKKASRRFGASWRRQLRWHQTYHAKAALRPQITLCQRCNVYAAFARG